jgi:hypothetical protein
MAPERVLDATRVPRERWRDRDRYQQSFNLSPGRWGVVMRQNREDHQLELQSMQ